MAEQSSPGANPSAAKNVASVSAPKPPADQNKAPTSTGAGTLTNSKTVATGGSDPKTNAPLPGANIAPATPNTDYSPTSNAVRPDGPGGNLPAAATSLDAAKALPDPGVATRGGRQFTPETPEERDERVNSGLKPGDHPPLTENDVIQGPGDRKNRKPRPEELEAGKLYRQGVLTADQQLAVTEQRGEHNDPPIDESAPKDVPADPRKVAESRGFKLKDGDE